MDCRNSQTDIVHEILVDPSDFDTVIHKAALMGHVDYIRKIVSEKPEMVKNALERKVRPLGSTPLRLASTGGHVDVVRFLLLELGASVDRPDFKGQTPLYVAIKGGYADCARVLLEHGANPDGSLENVCSPLYVATQNGNIECVLLLLEYGADPNDCKRLSLNRCPQPPPPPSNDNPLASGLYNCFLRSWHLNMTNNAVISQSPLYASVIFNRPNCYAALLLVGGGAELDLHLAEPRISEIVVYGGLLAHSLLNRNLSEFFVRLFVLFGGNLWQRDKKGNLATEQSSSNSNPSWIAFKTYMENPLTLQNLCRIRIRRCLGRKRLSSISSLPLPTSLIDFLHYKDEIDENYEPLSKNG